MRAALLLLAVQIRAVSVLMTGCESYNFSATVTPSSQYFTSPVTSTPYTTLAVCYLTRSAGGTSTTNVYTSCSPLNTASGNGISPYDQIKFNAYDTGSPSSTLHLSARVCHD